MARRILSDYPEKVQEMVEFIDRFPELQETPAQFQERCGQIALACFWKEQQAQEALHRNGNARITLPGAEHRNGVTVEVG
jgi:hypothetical protein